MQSYLVFIQKTNILRGRDVVSREVRERFPNEIMEAKSNISIQFIINIIQTQDRNLIKRKFAKFSNCTVKIYGSDPAHEGEERPDQTTENEFVNTNLRTIFGPRLPSLCSVQGAGLGRYESDYTAGVLLLRCPVTSHLSGSLLPNG